MKNKKEQTVKEIFEMVKNDGHEFIVSGEFEKIALSKPVGIIKSPEKIDLSKYIKQHGKYNKGFIKAGEIKIDCYHLEDNKRVISKRGLQNALGIEGNTSGQKLEEILKSYIKMPNCPDKILTILNGLETNHIIFIRKSASGSQPLTHGFTDDFFMDLCHAIDDLKGCGLIRPEDLYLSANAKILIRAFSKLGIRSYIDEATGYIKDKKENLRDNMTNIELIFQRLGEEATIEVTKQRNAIGFEQNKKAARDGGASAGDARKAYENRIGAKVVSSDNFLKNKEMIKTIQNQNLEFKDNQTFETTLENIALSKKPT